MRTPSSVLGIPTTLNVTWSRLCNFWDVFTLASLTGLAKTKPGYGTIVKGQVNEYLHALYHSALWCRILRQSFSHLFTLKCIITLCLMYCTSMMLRRASPPRQELPGCQFLPAAAAFSRLNRTQCRPTDARYQCCPPLTSTLQ